MKTNAILLTLMPLVLIFNACNKDRESPRTSQDFNFDWKFTRGEQIDAAQPGFDDSRWRDVRLPHDWSVEEPFTEAEGAGATAFLPGGIGWYRKTFFMPEDAADKKTWIEFDGVYNNSTVWLNGHELGHRPYGYIPFKYDLSPHLNYGEDANVIAVKADRTAFVDCRWYPGSGIYRNVKLVTVNEVHISYRGTFITTPEAGSEKALVKVQTLLRNDATEQVEVITKVTLRDPAGQVVGELEKIQVIPSGTTGDVDAKIDVENPKRWDTDHPNLYTATIQLISEDEVLDEQTITFGIRDIRFDSEEGFFLNGVNTLLKGVNLHHDGGLVGAAVPDGVWERRLRLLKEMGCNAIRTAHNPPSEAFLDLCDRIGFLVQDEAFDEFDNPKDKRNNFNQEKSEEVTRGYTEHFGEWAERDIKAMVLRDRNHPCIIMWSIGNEIEWTYPRYGGATGYWGGDRVRPDLNYYWDEPTLSIETMKRKFYAVDSGEQLLAPTAQKLADWIRELDTSRPVTANLVIPSVSHWSGYTDALDIAGYSYRQVLYDYGHNHYPEKMILGTENFPRWHEWKYVIDRPFIPGIFIWPGIGYMGESGRWPSHGGGGGLINLAGFKNPGFHHFKSFWNDEPYLYITTQTVERSPYQVNSESGNVEEKIPGWWKRQKWGWQDVNEYWNYREGQEIAIEAYTSCVSVELYLNERSLGVQKLGDQEDRILKWIVPYEDGTLTAKGTMPDGTEVIEEIRSAGEPSALRISADEMVLKADNYDVVHLVVQLEDSKGIPVKNMERRITFNIQGDCRLLCIDNGSSSNVEGFRSNTVMTYRGKCLLILQSNDSPGKITVTASADGMEDSSLRLEIK